MIYDVDILNARILIVDDNQSIVDLLKKMLTYAGYTSITSTTDPRDTMKLYESFHPDLVLLDINMPYVDGFKIIKKLKGISSDNYVPILILTGQHDRETFIRSLEAGAEDFLTKPFDQIETLTRIKNMLEVRLLHNRVRYQNEVLEDAVRVRTKELHDTRLEVIHRLGIAAEYKDNETGYHIIRMSKMCHILGNAIGNAMGMSKERADLLLQASPMHDVGKIGIPDSILLKPGKLDPDEWEIMKTHVSIGAGILDGHSSDLLVMAKTIAYTHHEKWDGSGYLNGLKGEQIPIVGRIVALADVFDALTSVRPYKEAWSVEDSVAEINRCKDKHFDPKLVDIFNTVLDDINSIKEQHKDPESIMQMYKKYNT